jgi:hypothetical protein
VAGSASSNGRSVLNVTANGPRTLVPYGPDTAGESNFREGVYNRFQAARDQYDGLG